MADSLVERFFILMINMKHNQLLPIVLSAKRESWRMMDSHADENDRRFSEIRPAVLERDDHTCKFCNFKSMRYQEVHHLDDNHGNNEQSNLVTACGWCHMCFHLGMCGLKDSGVVIWCPELTQAQINNLCRSIFVSIANNGKYSETCRKVYNILESRSNLIKDELGESAIKPEVIGQAFMDMSEEEYSNRDKKFPGLRILPKMLAFSEIVSYWQTENAHFGKLEDEDWSLLIPESETEVGKDQDQDIDQE